VQEVLATVKSLADEGATLLIVTHEMGFARQVSHRVVFMDKGQIAEQGVPAEIFERPASARLAEFLGSGGADIGRQCPAVGCRASQSSPWWRARASASAMMDCMASKNGRFAVCMKIGSPISHSG